MRLKVANMLKPTWPQKRNDCTYSSSIIYELNWTWNDNGNTPSRANIQQYTTTNWSTWLSRLRFYDSKALLFKQVNINCWLMDFNHHVLKYLTTWNKSNVQQKSTSSTLSTWPPLHDFCCTSCISEQRRLVHQWRRNPELSTTRWDFLSVFEGLSFLSMIQLSYQRFP